jgi:P-type E1-E2 ATPase
MSSMIELALPGKAPLRLQSLVLDLDGTLALDGELLPGVRERLTAISQGLEIWLITADTHGTAATLAPTLPVRVRGMAPGAGTSQKAALVNELGASQVAAIGNGVNDAEMLRRAALGIAVLGPEGLAAACASAAKIVAPNIVTALDLLLHPRRLTATLRP